MAVRPLGLLVALGSPAAAFAQNVNVAEVQVAPPSVTLRVGERTSLLATAFDRIGNVIPTIRFSWSSNNVQVVRVDNNGTITGVGGGVAIVEARVGSRRGQAAVQVVGPPAPGAAAGGAGGGAAQPPTVTGQPAGAADPLAGQPPGTGPAAALRIEPPAIYLLPSEHTRISPRALREDGSPAAPVAVAWRSLREDVASVDQNGNVVALAPGQGTIQITGAAGLTATAPVVVQQADIAIGEQGPVTLSPGELDTLRVLVPTQGNRAVSPLALQWGSSNHAVARVSLTGVVTAVAPGRATLTVSGLLQSRGIEVVVHRPVSGLHVVPEVSQGDIKVPLLGAVRFEATALAADDTPVPDARLRWSVADTAVASFDAASGQLTGRSVGRTQLLLRGPGQGLSVAWSINVVTGALRLAAARVGLSLGERYAPRPTYVDGAGTALAPARSVVWSTDQPGIATVTDDGTLMATGYGRARITATAPGARTATVDVFVQGELLVASSRGGRFQLYAAERANLAQLRRVTDDSAMALEPAYSPDGSRIAFVSSRDGNAELYVMDADGKHTVRLTTDPRADGHPVFTPDGQSILFHAARTRNQQIYEVGVGGGVARPLTVEPGANVQPSVSPDGRTIAFASARENNYDIWLMARDGTAQRAFTRSPQQKETYPRFLRDGALAYLVERRQGNRSVTQVVRADLATGQVTPLTSTDLFITSFAISPGGDLLALVVPLPGQERRRDPAYKVYVQPVAGGAPVPIPTAPGEQLATPAFQP